MSDEPSREAGQLPLDDVDDIIGIAAELDDAADERMALDEVKAIGRELGIDDEHVDDAVGVLARRREDAVRSRQAKQRSRRKAALVAGAVLALLVVFALLGQSGLKGKLVAVEQHKAQLTAVIERRAEVQARYEGQTMTRDAEHELAGALNRVGVERKRYDAAAAAYNAAAAGFPGGLWAPLFGLPQRVPLSDTL